MKSPKKMLFFFLKISDVLLNLQCEFQRISSMKQIILGQTANTEIFIDIADIFMNVLSQFLKA